MTANCRFSNIIQRLIVPRTIDQFGRKRCQKKHKDVDYNFLFQKYLLNMSSRLSKIRSVHTYVIPGRFILVESVATLALLLSEMYTGLD